MFNSRIVEISKSINNKFNLNCPLIKAFQSFYLSVFSTYWDYWLDSEKTDEAFIEIFEDVFPTGYLRRDLASAKNLFNDLLDIVKGDTVRRELTPIYTYVVYNIMQDKFNLYKELGMSILDDESYEELIQFLKSKDIDEEEYDFCTSWFVDPYTFNLDFENYYDSDYFHSDFAEKLAEIYLYDQHAEIKLHMIGVNISDFFDLLPNDIRNLCLNKYHRNETVKEYDFFISHASEDKESVAIPLTEELRKLNATAWLDKFELKIGDSLMDSINEGLIHSKKGVVILSPIYFEKFWTRQELNALFQKSQKGKNIILPIRHKITAEEIASKNLFLSDILSLSTDDYSIPEIAEALIRSLD